MSNRRWEKINIFGIITMYYNNYIYNLVKYLNRFGKEVIIFQCLRSPDALNQGISFFLIVEEREGL